MKRVISLMLSLCLLLSLCACGSAPKTAEAPPAAVSPAESTSPAEEIPMDAGSRILLNCSGSPASAFFTQYAPSDITAITFLDKPDRIAGVSGVDVSQDSDHSVFACVIEEGDSVHLYLYGRGGVLAPENCNCLFTDYVNLESIDFGGCFDTSGVTSMNGMFLNCRKLETVDLSCFDTSAVQDMSFLFAGCTSLKEVNLSSFDTGNVQSMTQMFAGAEALTNVDIPNLSTEALVEAQDFMEADCTLNGQPWKSVLLADLVSTPLHDGTVFTQSPDTLVNSIVDRLAAEFDIYYELSIKQPYQEEGILYTLVPTGENTMERSDLEVFLIPGEDADTTYALMVISRQNMLQGDTLSVGTLFEIYYALLGRTQEELQTTPPPLAQVASSPAVIMETSMDSLIFRMAVFADAVIVDYIPENHPSLQTSAEE